MRIVVDKENQVCIQNIFDTKIMIYARDIIRCVLVCVFVFSLPNKIKKRLPDTRYKSLT